MDDRIIDPSALNREPHVEPADAEESKEVKAQEALLHDVDPSLASADEVAEALNVDTHTGIALDQRSLETFRQSDFLPFAAGIEAGADMVIANGQAPEVLYDILAGAPAGTRFAGKRSPA